MSILHCIKLDKDLEGLERAPYPGELGKRILENVSKDAWQMWLDHQTMLINENNLNLFETSSQSYLKEQMEKYIKAEIMIVSEVIEILSTIEDCK